MKLLWVKADFLHPTDGGKQIRTLGMLKRLHSRHEVHYIGLDSGNPEGVARAGEYSTFAYPIEHRVPERGSLGFARQAAAGIFVREPVVISRYRSAPMSRQIETLTRREKFDAIVCDFLFPSANLPDPAQCVLFQHNVESVIWKRYVDNARTPLHRWYFGDQAGKVLDYEGRMCRDVRQVVAVSPIDAAIIRKQYQVGNVAAVSTGVDVEYFAATGPIPRAADLVFVGAMDWMPNIDGAQWFAREILPLIRKKKPDCTVVFAGRKPAGAILDLASKDGSIQVTGTVPDIRPHLWSAAVSIVPLRIGGGTRLKIFEAMAARVPVVSTRIGAEGLPVTDGSELYLADQPQEFADRCLELIGSGANRSRMIETAWSLVASRFSWDAASREFERALWEPQAGEAR